MSDSVDTSEPAEEQADTPRVSAGGNKEQWDTEQSHLHTLFVNMTGVKECIDRQRGTGVSRYVDADTTSVSAAASAVADDDGLGDTIDESQSAEEMR